MSGRFYNSVAAALALGSLVSALDPADPTITAPAVLARQNDDSFIGYVQSDSTWYSEACNSGLTWYQNGKYAQCCATTLQSCVAPTACVNGNLIYPLSSLSTTLTFACTENYDNKLYSICNTAFIYENMSDSSPQTDIVCGASAVNWSYYRAIPASATQTTAASVSATGTSRTSASLTSSTTAASSSSSGSKKSKSKAWIAGVIVGVLALFAIIGAGIFFCLRRKKNKTVAPQQGGAAMGFDPSQPPAGVAGYTDAKPQFVPQAQPYSPPTSPPIPQPYGQPAQHDPYAQQGAYGAQQGYMAAPQSPVPVYDQPVTHHAPSPASPPPPQQEYYGQSEQKYGYNAPPNGAAELGGDGHAYAPPAAPVASNPASPTPAPAPAPAPVTHAAELGDSSRQGHHQ